MMNITLMLKIDWAILSIILRRSNYKRSLYAMKIVSEFFKTFQKIYRNNKNITKVTQT